MNNEQHLTLPQKIEDLEKCIIDELKKGAIIEVASDIYPIAKANNIDLLKTTIDGLFYQMSAKGIISKDNPECIWKLTEWYVKDYSCPKPGFEPIRRFPWRFRNSETNEYYNAIGDCFS